MPVSAAARAIVCIAWPPAHLLTALVNPTDARAKPTLIVRTPARTSSASSPPCLNAPLGCMPGCTAASDCAVGQTCAAHHCVPQPCSSSAECPPNFDCPANPSGNLCVRRYCMSDSDCSFPCATDAGCAETCVDNACYAGPGSCVAMAK